MALQNIILLLMCIIICNQNQRVLSSILRVTEDHVYQRLSVEVTDQVPRHLCQNTLNNLEVSKTYLFLDEDSRLFLIKLMQNFINL